MGARDIGAETELLTRNVFTTLPFRAIHRSDVIDDPYWPISFSLTEDGFFFAVEPETELATNGGFLGLSI